MTLKKDGFDFEALEIETLAIEGLITDIAQSKKYRKLGICEDTIRDLLVTELKRHSKRGDAVKAARKKLHQIVAPYLGDPDYTQAITELDKAFDTKDPGAIKETCARIMQAHSTTKERLPVLDNFYHRIFEITGKPDSILDLACGLNPLAFPWMGLPTATQYYAYDIHQKRVDFLNHFFALQSLPPLAKQQDILVKFPNEEAGIAFIFKEVHRFERRQQGCTLPLLDALPVRHLVVSFPTRSLSGRRNLTDHYRELFQNLLQDRPWPLTEIKFEIELVFCVDKS
jgi:16S rRNA (guanine(1405)-N(7))-methyltransferase